MGEVSVREAAKVFNSAQLSAVAAGNFAFVKRVSSEFLGESFSSLGTFYDRMYARLSEHYRSEYFFKNYLVLRRLLGHHSPRTATMLTEFRVGKSKADCVIINGRSTCYEIKTEFDSLNRLGAQLQDYMRLFDEVYVVCSERNVRSVLEEAPETVGVLVLGRKNYFETKRKAGGRIASVDREILFKSLRKCEYLEIVRLISGRSPPSVANGKIFSACFDIVKKAPESLLYSSYLEVLKKYRPLNEDLVQSLPAPLKSAAVSYHFSPGEAESLTTYLKNREAACTVRS